VFERLFGDGDIARAGARVHPIAPQRVSIIGTKQTSDRVDRRETRQRWAMSNRARIPVT